MFPDDLDAQEDYLIERIRHRYLSIYRRSGVVRYSWKDDSGKTYVAVDVHTMMAKAMALLPGSQFPIGSPASTLFQELVALGTSCTIRWG